MKHKGQSRVAHLETIALSFASSRAPMAKTVVVTTGIPI